MTAVKNDHVDGTAIWESKRNQCRAEFAAKCVLSAIFMTPLKIISDGVIPSPFNYTMYWSPIKATQLVLAIKSSDLPQVIKDITNHCEAEPPVATWHQLYTIPALVRYGFIDKSHGDCIESLIKQYKTAKKVIKFYQFNFPDTYNQTNQQFVEAKKQMTQLNETWIQYRDLVLVPRLPNPEIKYDSSKK